MAVGFKLFPDQIDNDRFACLWQWLKQNRDLKIIYLTRQNLLATYTSLLIAQKDGSFGLTDESERTKTTVYIDPKKCLAEFQKRKHYNEEVRKYIRHHEVMELTYEELAMDPYYYLKEVQKYLGVDVCNLEISKLKQETLPPWPVGAGGDSTPGHKVLAFTIPKRIKLLDVAFYIGGVIKQETLPLSEVVVNYDELRRYFLGTKWEHCFDE